MLIVSGARDGTSVAFPPIVVLPRAPLDSAKVAYFSMEIHLHDDIPTYAGGLGVLAGDTVRAAADLAIPVVAVSLVHRQGYVRQRLDDAGNQLEEPAPWSPEELLTELPERIRVTVAGRPVLLRAFRYDVRGANGGIVPVLLLDANLVENDPADRALTDRLYGGDTEYRLGQEILLGIGGVRLLRALGCSGLERFHMNEGHAALLALELLDEHARAAGRAHFEQEDIQRVRERCVFTTHTPVPAGHDQFPVELANRLLGRPEISRMQEVFLCDGTLNLTYLALNLSHYVNGVAKRHGEVTQQMFAQHRIEAITNGIHAATWASPPFQDLFDRHLPGWRADNFSLRYALRIPLSAIVAAHRAAKGALVERVQASAGVSLDPEAFTIGFARRATAYKRPLLILRDPAVLRRIATEIGPIQILFGGKAHPRDDEGKRLIADVVRISREVEAPLRIVFLENYDARLARVMVAGVDLWLNTPRPPLEASGTSGMKAAVNGVPTHSVLDGWWLEGHVEGTTGWAIGRDGYHDGNGGDDARDAEDLYADLERDIVPMFYRRPDDYAAIMRNAIALTGSFFNTHRMLQQYVAHAYL